MVLKWSPFSLWLLLFLITRPKGGSIVIDWWFTAILHPFCLMSGSSQSTIFRYPTSFNPLTSLLPDFFLFLCATLIRRFTLVGTSQAGCSKKATYCLSSPQGESWLVSSLFFQALRLIRVQYIQQEFLMVTLQVLLTLYFDRIQIFYQDFVCFQFQRIYPSIESKRRKRENLNNMDS